MQGQKANRRKVHWLMWRTSFWSSARAPGALTRRSVLPDMASLQCTHRFKDWDRSYSGYQKTCMCIMVMRSKIFRISNSE